jgi:outer membrane protein assembly factor BamB
MRLPRSNRRTWIFAAVAVVIAVIVAVYAIHQLSKPTNMLNTHAAFVPPTTAKSSIPVNTIPVNNFAWPIYGYTNARTRDFTGDPNLTPPFKVAWKFGGNALLEFPASIWGNNLYLIDDGATVKRVNITTGKQIWERHVGMLSAATPALDIARKELFVPILSLTGSHIGDTNGELAALSMTSGKILWKFPVPSGSESSPIVVGNSVYFGDQGGTEYSLNVLTGHVNWSFSTGGSIKAGPAYYGGDLFFGNYAGSFYALKAATGKEVWSDSPGGEFYSTPAVAFGRVYTGNNNGAAYSFVASDGTVAWTRTLGGYVYSAPAVADTPGLGPTVYIGSYDSHLYALNARTGATDWTSPYLPAARPGISGSATVINNTVYVSTVYSPGSFGFNASTGKEVFHFDDGSYTTVLADPSAVFLMGKYVIYKLVPAH